MAASKWSALFDEIPKFFREASTNTDLTDPFLLPIFNKEYIELHHETYSLFQKEVPIDASTLPVDITDLNNLTGAPALADNVIGIVIDDDNPILFYDNSATKLYRMEKARDREHLADYSDYKHYFLQFPKIYVSSSGAASDLIYATIIFSGTETATGGSDSDNSPIFQDELQPLGEKALMARVVAAIAWELHDNRYEEFKRDAMMATDNLAYAAARLIGGSVLREYFARKNAQ